LRLKSSSLANNTNHNDFQFDAGSTINQNHNEIANKYVKPFTDLLTSIFPNLDLKEATALTWGGLKETTLWKSNFESDIFAVGKSDETISYTLIQGYMNGHRFNVIGNSKCAN
jgi:hypothetical protein